MKKQYRKLFDKALGFASKFEAQYRDIALTAIYTSLLLYEKKF